MRALVVHAHSQADSFVSAMRDTIIETLIERGDHVVQTDLYAMGFNPVLSPADFGKRQDESHLAYGVEQAIGYANGTLAPDVIAEVEKVKLADLIVFTFPLYWFSVPAILKGWIDRVFIPGVFYGGREIYSDGKLVGKRALAAVSLGERAHMFGENSVHGDLTQGLLRHFLSGTLGYVGMSVTEPFFAHHAPYVGDEARRAMLAELRAYVRDIEIQPVLPMPQMENFVTALAARFGPASVRG